MYSKTRMGLVSLLCITLLGGTFFFFHNRPQTLHKEAQTHLDTLHSLSGTLTNAEKQTYFSDVDALGKIMDKQLQQSPESRPFVSPEELERLQAHISVLIRENPDLAIHAHGENHGHSHEDPKPQQDELADINAAIEEVKASEVSSSAKEALLSILEHRRNFLLYHEKESAELEKKFKELLKTDPTLIGLEKSRITGEYTRLYPNMLSIKKRRTHYPDGTFDEEFAQVSSHATDPEIANLIKSYRQALDTLPPWKVPPPPEHEGLHLSVEYDDVYLTAAGESKTDVSPQTPEQPLEMSEDTSTQLLEEYPKPIITQEEVVSWQDSLQGLQESTDIEMEEMRKFFQEAVGIPLDRFLEMTDAEIEAELNRQISPSQSESVSSITDTSLGLSSEKNLKAGLRQRFSPERSNQAIQMLSLYGPKEGVRRLKDVDPEVATHIEIFLQKQGEN